MSRPHTLDEIKKSRILALLKSGCARATAAAAVNCDPRTITRTAHRDPQFADQLALAERATEIIHLENLNRAGSEPKYWRASAWILERTRPERYGKSNPEVVTPSQMAHLFAEIAEIIVQEVPIAVHRQQILKRFDALLKEAFFEISSTNPSHDVSLLELSSADSEQQNE
jgi:hypothetical protein